MSIGKANNYINIISKILINVIVFDKKLNKRIIGHTNLHLYGFSTLDPKMDVLKVLAE